ncbi:hypothetical protein ACEPPN_015264 [Leptodophora sp. 'Broadleaf-Isolate-01']
MDPAIGTNHTTTISSYSYNSLKDWPHYLSHSSSDDAAAITYPVTLSLLQVSDTVEHRDLVTSALQKNHNIGSIFLAGLQNISNSGTAHDYLPDIHANHLSLRQSSTLQAYLANARALYFDVPSLMHRGVPIDLPDGAVKHLFMPALAVVRGVCYWTGRLGI